MRPRALPPEALFMVGAISQYLGAAVAATLFDELAPSGVAVLRVLGAGAMIVLLRRSWRRRWERAVLGRAAAFGVSLAAMNLCFYLAMDKLPLGNAVAIEFTGPVVVAAVGARTLRSAGALVLAVAGVLVLAGVEAEGTARGGDLRAAGRGVLGRLHPARPSRGPQPVLGGRAGDRHAGRGGGHHAHSACPRWVGRWMPHWCSPSAWPPESCPT